MDNYLELLLDVVGEMCCRTDFLLNIVQEYQPFCWVASLSDLWVLWMVGPWLLPEEIDVHAGLGINELWCWLLQPWTLALSPCDLAVRKFGYGEIKQLLNLTRGGMRMCSSRKQWAVVIVAVIIICQSSWSLEMQENPQASPEGT